MTPTDKALRVAREIVSQCAQHENADDFCKIAASIIQRALDEQQAWLPIDGIQLGTHAVCYRADGTGPFAGEVAQDDFHEDDKILLDRLTGKWMRPNSRLLHVIPKPRTRLEGNTDDPEDLRRVPEAPKAANDNNKIGSSSAAA